MPGEPPVTAGTKSRGQVKRISIPRVQSSTDTELQSQQSGSTPLQPTALHYVSFRSDIEDSTIPPVLRSKLLDLFQQIEKEFEMLCAENTGCMFLESNVCAVLSWLIQACSCSFYISVQEKIEALNERLERECYGSGERSLPPGDLQDCTDNKNLAKQKCKFNLLISLNFTQSWNT